MIICCIILKEQYAHRLKGIICLPYGRGKKQMNTNGFDDDVCESFEPSSADELDQLRDRLAEVEGLSQIFRVLADETRTKLIYVLSLKELCVCDLAEVLGISVPAVSHHLRLLRAMRLVKYRRDGKSVYYSLDDHHIITLIRQAQEHFSEEPSGLGK
jgi:DNA-binding transcriptional ArsR family regulator